jgi:hypothetical protein
MSLWRDFLWPKSAEFWGKPIPCPFASPAALQVIDYSSDNLNGRTIAKPYSALDSE